MDLKNKKVLLMGLGILGGGVATARFLHRRGAILTITDMKDEVHLKPSLEALKDLPNIRYVIGHHDEEDFLQSDIIVVNPDVPLSSPFLQKSIQAGKQIENELSLFYKFCPTEKIVAITGTRGKTTTTNWTYHFIKSAFPNTLIGGNSPDNPFLKIVEECEPDFNVVVEVPSFQLELVSGMKMRAPKATIITNLYQDHLNRHGTMEGYAKAKQIYLLTKQKRTI
jgi:UDP-N-acetylmuramoylalanine--D-glutamate ligase